MDGPFAESCSGCDIFAANTSPAYCFRARRWTGGAVDSESLIALADRTSRRNRPSARHPVVDASASDGTFKILSAAAEFLVLLDERDGALAVA